MSKRRKWPLDKQIFDTCLRVAVLSDISSSSYTPELAAQKLEPVMAPPVTAHRPLVQYIPLQALEGSARCRIEGLTR